MEWWEESCAEEKKVSEGNGEGWVPPVLWFRQDIRECEFCYLFSIFPCSFRRDVSGFASAVAISRPSSTSPLKAEADESRHHILLPLSPPTEPLSDSR